MLSMQVAPQLAKPFANPPSAAAPQMDGPRTKMRTTVARRALANVRERLEAAGAGNLAVSVDAKGRIDHAPRKPAKVSTADAGNGKVAIMWQPGRDDKGVVAYEIFRNGKRIGRVSASTWFVDKRRSSNDRYEVRALDATGKHSAKVTTTVIRDARKPGPDGQPLAQPQQVPTGQPAPQQATGAQPSAGQAPQTSASSAAPSAGAGSALPSAAGISSLLDKTRAALIQANGAAAATRPPTANAGTSPSGASTAPATQASGQAQQGAAGAAPAAASKLAPPAELATSQQDDITALVWKPVDGAAKYAVFENGTLIGHTIEPVFAAKTAGMNAAVQIQVASVDERGAMSTPSAAYRFGPTAAGAAG